MLNLQISLQLEEALMAIARRNNISAEAAAIEALQIYVREQSAESEPEKNYSFIGIAQSSKITMVDNRLAAGRVPA